MSQLIVNNLSLGYDGIVVSEGINFQVNKGDYLCIVGENGSGKSTLMKTLLGLQKPLSGEVILSGGLSRAQIGYLPQQTPVQKDFPASVQEIVLSGFLASLGSKPFYSRVQKQTALDNMKNSEFTIRETIATATFPAASSKEFCLPERFAPLRRCSSWTSRFRVLTRRLPQKCTKLSQSSIAKKI